MNNYYLNTKLAEAHRQEMLREAEQQRRLSSLSQGRQSDVRAIVIKVAIVVLATVLALVLVAAVMTHAMLSLALHTVASSHFDPQAWVQHLTARY